MPRFVDYNYKKDAMLAINFEEQLQPGTFEYAIHYLIDNKLDLSVDASKEWSGTFKEPKEKRAKIKRQIRYHMKAHKALDENENQNNERTQRIEQTLETLNHAADKIGKFLKSAEPRMGQGKRKKEVKSNITDNQSAKMTTSKGTIQGCNGVAAVDKKHQVVVDAQAFSEGQEYHTLQRVIEKISERYKRLSIHKDIYGSGCIVTADTGFCNEANMKYLHENDINGYIPDNQFRSRDPKFDKQKSKYGKRNKLTRKTKEVKLFSANDFQFDPRTQHCVCPAGKELCFLKETEDEHGNHK